MGKVTIKGILAHKLRFLLTGVAAGVTPKVRRDGPFALGPTPVLRLILSFYDEEAEVLHNRYRAGIRTLTFPGPIHSQINHND